MGLLLKIAIFAVVAYGIWKTAKRVFSLLGGDAPKAPPPAPQRREAPPPAAAPRAPVIEDTRACAVCGAYVSVSAAKCGQSGCPQA